VTSVNTLRQSIALGCGDPFMERVKEPTLLTFINDASRDLINSGWYLPQEHAENTEILNAEYEYDVPAQFVFVKELRIGDTPISSASTLDTGTTLGAAITSTTAVTHTVSDSSIWAINDILQIDIEIFLVTAIPSSTTITTTGGRGYFSTTAATHDNASSILRPLAGVTFEEVIPRPYWRMKLQTGGANTTTAALGSRPQFVFNSDFFSYTAGTPLQVVGQQEPNVYTAGSNTLDSHVESFLSQRATAYAARFLYAQGDHPHLNQISREAWGASEEFLRKHPQRFRVLPHSTRVPGR